MWLLLHLSLFLPIVINASPTHIAKSASVAASFDAGAPPSLLSFDNGKVGVNFLGYHASAGLGGLLTGNAADGGLHAEAGTPFGQRAGAGLGGGVNAGGRAAGGLYAGATAGGGVAAGAGLAGETTGTETHVVKEVYKAPTAVAVGKIKASVAAPVIHKEVEIVEDVKPQTTYIERTVIPNYVEKTVRVPTYVEKTIRVPAEPTIIEKTVDAPASVGVRGGFTGEVVKEVEVPQSVTYVQKTRIHGRKRPHIHNRVYYKNVGYGGGGGFTGFGGGFGGGYAGGFGGGYGGGGAASATVTKTANSQFFNDIFNIPISTLGAVNKFVSGLAGGASGSLAVSKSFGVGGAAGGAVY